MKLPPKWRNGLRNLLRLGHAVLPLTSKRSWMCLDDYRIAFPRNTVLVSIFMKPTSKGPSSDEPTSKVLTYAESTSKEPTSEGRTSKKPTSLEPTSLGQDSDKPTSSEPTSKELISEKPSS